MMNDFLEMKKLREGVNCPVMVAHIPKPIMKEIDGWVKESRKVKNHSLSALKAQPTPELVLAPYAAPLPPSLNCFVIGL